MRARGLLEQLNDLPENLLLEAQPKAGRSGFSWRRWTGIAACFCVVAGAALLGVQFWLPAPAEPSPSVDYSQTVNYSDLSFGNTYLPEGLQVHGNATVSIQLEDNMEQALLNHRPIALVEVTVTDMRTKEYRYDVWDVDRLLHQWAQTLQYDFQIEQVYYGSFEAGQALTVENNSYLLDPEYLMEIGGRYVLPVYEEGEILSFARDETVLEGDVHRDTPYACYYLFQPPIQRTVQGDYVMPSSWQLLSAYSRQIVMDLSLSSESPGYYDYFEDKMRLVTGEDFARQMAVLVEKLSQS